MLTVRVLNVVLPVCQEVGDQRSGGGWQAKLSELSVDVGVVTGV